MIDAITVDIEAILQNTVRINLIQEISEEAEAQVQVQVQEDTETIIEIENQVEVVVGV